MPSVTGAVGRVRWLSDDAEALRDQLPTARRTLVTATLFPTPPPEGLIPACSEAGIIGALTGVIGTLMAMEAIKLITGIGEPLIGRLLLYDGIAARFETIRYRRKRARGRGRMTDITLRRLDDGFDRWDELLELILASFAYMNGLIDPPSSALSLTPQSLREKSEGEIGHIAFDDDQLAGCVFCRPEPDNLYIGKLAILPSEQGKGIGRRLLAVAEAIGA